MERLVTVLLPVYNVESTLATVVAETLEVVSDFSGQFELVIVDDGSDDATSEVIDELTRSYPQVHSVRHGEHCGRDEAIQTGLRHSTGEMILLRDATDAEGKVAYHMLDRTIMEQLHRSSRPARPVYLSPLPAAGPIEHFSGGWPIASPGV